MRAPHHTLLAGEDLQRLTTLSLSAPLTDQQRHALVGVRHGATWTNQSLRASFPMDSREAQRALALADLRARGTVVLRGGRGLRNSSDELVRCPASPSGTTGAPET